MTETHASYPSDLRREFPDYDPATLPAIPPEWVDNSWHNDACPCFVAEAAELCIYIDYADPAQREIGDSFRFAVLSLADATLDHCELSTDDWQAVLDLVAERSCEGHRDTGRSVCAHCGKPL